MKPEELKEKIKELEREIKLKRSELIRQYCNAKNPYKVGDIFTDHIGHIKITKIRYSVGIDYYSTDACCIYEGEVLTMDKKPKKRPTMREAWQSNLRETPVNRRHFTVKKDPAHPRKRKTSNDTD